METSAKDPDQISGSRADRDAPWRLHCTIIIRISLLDRNRVLKCDVTKK